MNIFKIALKLIKTNFRIPFNLLIFMAFPLVLILILGTAFSGMFGEVQIEGDILVFYEERSSVSTILEDNFHLLSNFTFTEIGSVEKGKEALISDKYEAMISVDENLKNITIFYSGGSSLERTVLETFLRSVLSKYNLMDLFISEELGLPDLSDTGEYVQVETLNNSESPGAMDYYGITIMTMIIMFGAYISGFGIIEEKQKGTLPRMKVSPVKSFQIFWGISLGAMIQILLQTLIIILVGKFLIKINYGDRPLIFVSIIMSQILMVVGLGIFLASAVKDHKVVDIIINLTAQLTVFLGGGYIILPENGFLSGLSKLSPIYWINKGLFESIYSESNNYIRPAILLPLGLALLFMIVSSINLRRREN